MRELKFRAWDTTNHFWIGNVLNSTTLHINEWFLQKDIVFQQYTGLKDKNGVEIYEGDIIYRIQADQYFKVEYQAEEAAFVLVDMYNESWGFLALRHNSEIVGNIFENPELLKHKAMRELKFRAWDKLEQRFITCDEGYQGHYILSLKGEFHNLQNGSGGKEYIVQQYTELKDKNGKEIYEGDIVKSKYLTYGNRIAVVGLDTAFGIFYTDVDYYPAIAFSHCFSMMEEHNEVIGNIFENPELLKQ